MAENSNFSGATGARSQSAGACAGADGVNRDQRDDGASLGLHFSERGGQPVVNFKESGELAPPSEYCDRIEWVRKSYERFIEKVLEIETLRGAHLAF